MKIWSQAVYVVCISVLLTLKMPRSFEIIRCSFTKMGCNSKTRNRSAKRMKIWVSGVYAVYIWVLFYLKHVKVILVPFGVFFPQSWTETRKWLIVDRNMGLHGYTNVCRVVCIYALLTLNMPGHFGVIR